MKTLTVITASGLAVGGLYAGGAFDRGQVYDLSLDDTRARLEAVDLSGDPASATGASNSRLTEVGDTLTWNTMAGGRLVGSFTATLKAEDPTHTRVLLSYRNGTVDGGFGDRLMSTKFMRSYAETSFYERVDAALDGRPVDPARAMQAFAANAQAHPEQVREIGLATQEIFQNVAQQLKTSGVSSSDYAAQVYASHPPPPRETMAAATRPNDGATRPSTNLPND